MTLLPKNFFNNQIARPKTALFGKRTQIVAYLRLNSERVNLRDFLTGEALIIAQREKNGG